MLQAAVEVERQSRISRGKSDDIRSTRRKLQARKNVISLQIRKVSKNFTHINPITQHFKNVIDTNTHSANARTPATFSGFNGDSVKQMGFQNNLPRK